MKKRIQEFNSLLFDWSDFSYRAMAWRPKKRDSKKAMDPYHILVSEIMLQQTQVDRVRTKYAEFMTAFPDVDTLAAASLGSVLRLWSGLGYNRRAKYLHAAAKQVVLKHKGKFPRDFALLQELPGIGRSTAAALMAFAWNEPYPMIDTNLRRILVRCFFEGKIPHDKVLFDFAKDMIPLGRGRAWNYAMLDLGAMECTARHHKDSCPMFDIHGEVEDFVYKKPQAKFKGSKRSFRGILMRQIAQEGHISRNKALLLLAEAPVSAEILVDELIAEGLLKAHRGVLRLP